MPEHFAEIWINPVTQAATMVCTAHDADHQRQCAHHQPHPDHRHPKHGISEHYRWCRWNYHNTPEPGALCITDECLCPAVQQAVADKEEIHE